ncbi:UNVERIFIED_CONTAM: putative glutamate carboxypeptidase AMP1 [Sesamum latifolium]|uniref:Glutamate carboxypeptidase AMP1 n=1 Tax=Sesamum latifolium TaxID=2727402 RepID=A0AAW2VE81_9LAMI
MPFSAKHSSTLLYILTLSLLALYTTLRHRPHPPPASANTHRNTPYYRDAFLSSASNYTIAAYLRHLTLRPHLAGTPLSLSTALYVQSHFQSLGLTTHLTSLSSSTPSTPLCPRVLATAVFSPLPSPNPPSPKMALWRHTTLTPPPARRTGVGVKGCVGIVRRGSGMSRYEVVANAAAHGVSAVLMYTEGEYKEGVERGTVMNGLGDPLTPGWAGIEGGEKLDLNDPRVTEKFPAVPSLPVSEAAAESIIRSLEGAGVPYE